MGFIVNKLAIGMNKLENPIQLSEFEGKKVLVVTGAGMSVAAGIPPYWGDNGIYTELQAKYGAPIDSVLSIENFDKNPDQVWSYISDALIKFSGVEPTLGYHAITKIESVASQFDLYTQNCDGLHKKAGTQSVNEIHGNVESAQCTKCDAHDYDYMEKLGDTSPTCKRCGGVLRPNIVLFGMFPHLNEVEAVYRAQQADIVLVVGTQAYFSYITSLFNIAASTGGRLIFVDKSDAKELLSNPLISAEAADAAECYTGEAEKFFSLI